MSVVKKQSGMRKDNLSSHKDKERLALVTLMGKIEDGGKIFIWECVFDEGNRIIEGSNYVEQGCFNPSSV